MPIDLLEKLTHLTQSAAGRLTVRSALNPLLWFTAIMTPVCFVFAFLLRQDHLVLLILVAAGVLPMVLTSGVALYFAISKPERLQSEDYQLRSESLRIIREKGGRLKLDPASLESIAHPPPQLPHGGAKDDEAQREAP